MSSNLLPDQFAGLEPFARDWALWTERERLARRFSGTMEEMRGFYEALLPRMDEVMDYLDQFPLDDMPDEARRLLYMSLSLVEVSQDVERFRRVGGSEISIEPGRLVPEQ